MGCMRSHVQVVSARPVETFLNETPTDCRASHGRNRTLGRAKRKEVGGKESFDRLRTSFLPARGRLPIFSPRGVLFRARFTCAPPTFTRLGERVLFIGVVGRGWSLFEFRKLIILLTASQFFSITSYFCDFFWLTVNTY